MGRYKTRKPKPRKAKTTILIVGEGQTEKLYFTQLRQDERLSNVKITLDCRNRWQFTEYRKLVEYIDRKYIKRSKDKNIFDYIFALKDLDVALSEPKLQQKLAEISKEVKKKRVFLIVSTPCFELWFLLHFELYQRPANKCEEVITALRKYIPQYDKTKKTQQKINFYHTYRERLDMAMQNARALRRKHNSQQGDLPYTDVYKIIEIIKKQRMAVSENSGLAMH